MNKRQRKKRYKKTHEDNQTKRMSLEDAAKAISAAWAEIGKRASEVANAFEKVHEEWEKRRRNEGQ